MTKIITREHITDLQLIDYAGFRELTTEEKMDIACWDAFERGFRAAHPGQRIPARITLACS